MVSLKFGGLISKKKISTMLKYTPQPPHPISEEGLKFLASLSERERKLHEMMSAPSAARGLGSSYFVERTHAFRKWKLKTSS
jgi:hypothetical protein